MECDLCKKEIDGVTVILSLKLPGGAPCVMTCLDCAKSSGRYCLKHNRPHLGFGSDFATSACVVCIEETVKEKTPFAMELVTRMQHALPDHTFRHLLQTAAVSSSIANEVPDISILRFVASRAKRYHQTVEQVVDEVVATRSADMILR